MTFRAQLNAYMEQLDCSAKTLGQLSGISGASLSRYRSGARVPALGTRAFAQLCDAIARLAAQKNLPQFTAETVKASFLACEDFATADKEVLRRNFNALIAQLNINLTRLSQSTNYDTSTIFRIRNGSRNPGDARQFAQAVAAFVAKEMQDPARINTLAGLLGCTGEQICDPTVRYEKIKSWLLEQPAQAAGNDSVSDFLNRLDTFDLNAYIRVIQFDQMKVPTVPFQIPYSKTYFGIQAMMESELDFLKATVLSKSTAPVTMYSDMPMAEMAKDPEFPKKWMYGMGLLLKKGLHLNQIHNLDRSFDEMMLGLESWIPMYMTGQITPYYFKHAQGNIFLHLLKVSGAAALTGEAITDSHADGKYYLTKSKREVAYYQKRAAEMLRHAEPLMDIYRSQRAQERNAFLLAQAAKPGCRRSILSTLPLHTVPPELLERMLTRNGISNEEKEKIRQYAAAQHARVLTILQNGTIEEEVPLFSAQDFANDPPVLELSGVFCERDIPYTAEEYAAHLQAIDAFAAQNPNYRFRQTPAHTFRNLQIYIHRGQWAMVSKGKAPAIHFVIRHPKLRSAIEHFMPPITECE